jgi:hypothetical protein
MLRRKALLGMLENFSEILVSKRFKMSSALVTRQNQHSLRRCLRELKGGSFEATQTEGAKVVELASESNWTFI